MNTNQPTTTTRNGQQSHQSGDPRSQTDPLGTRTSEFWQSISRKDVRNDMSQAMDNLMSQDFMLGAIEEADRHELKLLARNMAERIIVDYPDPKSNLQGRYRAMILDEPGNEKRSLTRDEKELIRQMSWVFMMRLSRSLDAMQQDKLADVTQRKEVVDGRKDNARWNIFS